MTAPCFRSERYHMGYKFGKRVMTCGMVGCGFCKGQRQVVPDSDPTLIKFREQHAKDYAEKVRKNEELKAQAIAKLTPEELKAIRGWD